MEESKIKDLHHVAPRRECPELGFAINAKNIRLITSSKGLAKLEANILLTVPVRTIPVKGFTNGHIGRKYSVLVLTMGKGQLDVIR